MSKDEAWKRLENAWSAQHSEFCIGNCKCDEELDLIKEALSV